VEIEIVRGGLQFTSFGKWKAVLFQAAPPRWRRSKFYPDSLGVTANYHHLDAFAVKDIFLLMSNVIYKILMLL
jgi:hypothetical protein